MAPDPDMNIKKKMLKNGLRFFNATVIVTLDQCA